MERHEVLTTQYFQSMKLLLALNSPSLSRFASRETMRVAGDLAIDVSEVPLATISTCIYSRGRAASPCRAVGATRIIQYAEGRLWSGLTLSIPEDVLPSHSGRRYLSGEDQVSRAPGNLQRNTDGSWGVVNEGVETMKGERVHDRISNPGPVTALI